MNEPYEGLCVVTCGLMWLIRSINLDNGRMVMTPLEELVDANGCPIYAVEPYETVRKIINIDPVYGRRYLHA